MRKQKKLIHNENWDILVILDACRFDYFEKNYLDFIGGSLSKVKSSGSNTAEWLKKTFDYQYDYTYISANPYANSLGFDLNEISGVPYSWSACNHFTEIIDAWKNKWSEEIGSVHPRDMNLEYFKEKDSDNIILHYLQPHEPFINVDCGSCSLINRTLGKIREDKKSQSNLRKIKEFFGPKIENILGKEKYWNFKDLLNLKSVGSVEYLYRKGGIDSIFRAYEDNLRICLESLSNLLDEIEKKEVFITSDHGQAYGDEGVWFHPIENDLPVLRNVPWLKVNL